MNRGIKGEAVDVAAVRCEAASEACPPGTASGRGGGEGTCRGYGGSCQLSLCSLN